MGSEKSLSGTNILSNLKCLWNGGAVFIHSVRLITYLRTTTNGSASLSPLMYSSNRWHQYCMFYWNPLSLIFSVFYDELRWEWIYKTWSNGIHGLHRNIRSRHFLNRKMRRWLNNHIFMGGKKSLRCICTAIRDIKHVGHSILPDVPHVCVLFRKYVVTWILMII